MEGIIYVLFYVLSAKQLFILTATTHKIYLVNHCREEQRLSTEGKIVSKYCNISKTRGGGGVHQPTPLYHSRGMTLRVSPRFNKGLYCF